MSLDISTLKQIILKHQYQIDDLEKDIAFLREQAAQPKWQPIETAPKEGVFFVIGAVELYSCDWGAWRDDARTEEVFKVFPESDKGFGVMYSETRNGDRLYAVKPTHWMPLPEPPEGTK